VFSIGLEAVDGGDPHPEASAAAQDFGHFAPDDAADGDLRQRAVRDCSASRR